MDLRYLTDEALEIETTKAVRNERMSLICLLHHLLENEKRKLYSKLKYQSVYDYLIRKHGYSEDEAYRKGMALKVFRAFPELESKIADGSLSQTLMGMLKGVLKSKISREEKLATIEKVAGKSTREAAKILNPKKNINQIKIDVSPTLPKKIEKLKGLLAHTNPNLSTGELFEMLCDFALQEWDPGKSPAAPRENSHAEMKRQVWREAQGECSNCGSYYAPEIDHRIAKGMGGASIKENYRLLCRSCNQRAAIEMYGIEKILGKIGSREEFRKT